MDACTSEITSKKKQVARAQATINYDL